jgi:hypothetical protein
MLVHGGLSRVLVGPWLWKVLGGVVSKCIHFFFGNGGKSLVLPVCSLTRMVAMMTSVLHWKWQFLSTKTWYVVELILL